MSRKNVEDIYPLSPLQQGILFHTLFETEPGVYFVQHRWSIDGALDEGALARAFQDIVDRHPILRTAFVWDRRDRPMQVVRERVRLPFEQVDLRGLDGVAQGARVAEIAASDRARGFELTRAPLMRVTLLRLGEAAYQVVWSSHHLLLDGWSTGLVTNELWTLYRAHAAHEPPPAMPRPRPYGEYIGWIGKQPAARSEAYFRKDLAGFRAPTPLGVDRRDASVPGEAFDDRRLTLSPAFAEELTAFARKHQLTASTVLQAAWGVVLSRYSREEDVVFGVTVSGRSADVPGIEKMIGLFINTLAVRVRAMPDETALRLLAALQDRQSALRELEHTSLVDVQGWSEVPRGTPLFESILVFENFPFDDSARGGLRGIAVRPERTHDRPDLPLTVVASMRRGVLLRMTYDRRRFDDATIERALGHLANVLQAIVRDPSERISRLPMLSDDERRRAVEAWNATEAEHPAGACLHQLFEAQADRTPDALALVDGAERVAYRELEARSNRLASLLRARGVGPEVLVGICLGRGAELVVAILAVLKAGGAYVPLDPAYPRERIAFTLQDAKAKLLLTERAVLGVLPDLPDTEALVLDAERARIAAEPEARGASSSTGANLAYVLFTSGSTGRPKGVAIEHHSPVALVSWARTVYGPADWARTLFSTSVCFDLSIFEMFVPLSWGGAVIVAENALALPALPAANEVTLVNTVPSAMAELVRAGAVPASVRTVNLAGEPLTHALAREIYAIPTIERLLNLYGPTEDTTYSTYAEGDRASGLAPPIGRPLANGTAYVLDASLSPVPIGVAGELYLGGAGLARGYLHRPELTTERFVAHPFSDAPGARLYRTGDLVRASEDGTLHYVGRIDHQVKLRGFRIELGEIEAVLAKHAALREAVAIVREDAPGDRRLVAYVVARPGADAPPGAELRALIEASLPAFMVPSAFVVLVDLPLTPNGKVDRKALPPPDASPGFERTIVPPRGPIEEVIVSVFAEVLRLDPALVGAHDGFFELGGHSLLATAAVSRMRAAFSIDLPLRALFDAPTASALAPIVQRALSSGEPAALGAIPRTAADSERALSFAEERLWFLAQLTPDDPSYNIPLSLRLEGPLDVDVLARALGEIVRRHEVLRTRFEDVDGRPVARVEDAVPVALRSVRLDARSAEERDAGARAAASDEACHPFDLANDFPFRATLLTLGAEEHQLLFTMHHVVADGWSLGVIYQELSALYRAFAEGAPSPLPELGIQVRDYAAWQRAHLSGERYDRELAWWRARLGGAPRALDLPSDRARPPVPSHRGASVRFTLPADVVKAVKDLSRREGATPFMTLLAAFDALLHRITGQDDLLVGTPIAGRTHAETEHLVGLFVNTLVVRAKLGADLPFRELVARVKEACLGAFAHQDMPFEQLVRELEPDRDPSRSPLFQVSFTLQAEPIAPPVLPGLAVRRAGAENTTSKFDLTLALFDGPSGMSGMIEHATDLFDAPTIERMVSHFVTLLAGAVRAPEKRLAELPLLPDAERDLVVRTWNETSASWPEDATIHELFEAHVDRDPSAIALVFEGREVTYADLDRRANRLAHHLLASGVGMESRVGISMRRSPDLIVALLGTLKAGAAWVPLDPAYPSDRLAFMIEDAGLAIIVTEESVAPGLPLGDAAIVRVDADAGAIEAQPDSRPALSIENDGAAYVIYTSGSTGRPKGVVVEHRGLGNVAAVHARTYGVGPGTRVLQFSSINFDASVWDIVMALLNGATLVLAPQDALLPGPDLLRTLTENRVSIMTVPPSVLAALPHADLPELRTIVVAGEACSEDLVARWAPGRHFWDAYGPTEASICASMAECFAGGGKPSIGKPIANASIFIVDPSLNPLPIGVPGELCIGGVGLARGYLNRPELTAERFVASPFHAGERLYRTGDLARWQADGTIEFLGRIDHQIKLRGFRIELGEIDAVLRQHEGVSDAVAVLRDDRGEPRIVGYFVARGETATADLRAYLRERLPEHMVPSAFVRLDAMPLTPNGKVDRAALPAPELVTQGDAPFVAPRGPIEEAIAAIFAEVLHVPQVAAHGGFFELGGHSLVATQAIARVRAAFAVDIPLRALFESPTPALLATVVQATLAADRGPAPPPIERAPRGGDLPLSFGQERLWFLAQLEPGNPSYVIPTTLRLRGALDVAALARALEALVHRHESLRTTFVARGGKPAQIVHEPAPFELAVADLSALPEGDRLEAARTMAAQEILAPFDLERGPLLRARLVRLADDDHALAITVHHIVSDGWSQAIVHRELSALYAAFASGADARLAALPIQVADYAAWQRAWLSGDVFDEQLAYWRERLATAPRALDLPADRPRPPVPSHRGDRRPFALPADLSRSIEVLAQKEGATLFMTLLAAFEVLLHRTTGQSDLVVGTPIAGRARAETEGLVGFFINNLVLRVEVTPELSFREVLRRVREACLGAYAHQDVPFERLVQELAPERDLSRSPLFQVMFTLQNEPRDAMSLPGLAIERLRADAPTAKIDLSVAMSSGPRGLGGVVEYATDLFDAATIDRTLAHLAVVLEGIAKDPGARVSDLPILPAEERALVVETWNQTRAPWPEGATIHALFEAHVDRDPSAIALVFEGRETSYADLDRRATQLASHLRARGVGLESRVGISMRRSPELIVALLGTLKAGAAWVPLDPAYPRDRLSFMIEDAGISILLTQSDVEGALPPHGAGVVHLDPPLSAIAGASTDRPVSGATSSSAAYVIYTSGSTGRPKGVVVEHRGLGNVAAVHARTYGVGPGTRVLQFSSINFDASVWDIVMALLNGATLVLAPQDALLPGPDLLRTLTENRVSIMTVPPSVLAALPHADLPELRTIVVAGEACSEDLVARWAPGRHFWDAYGPTEASICASMAECFAGGGKPSIGKPIANASIFIVDPSLNPLPIGVPGELCIGGVGLARGYLNRPELTAERFVASPFHAGERLYRTGDLARWQADGTIEFLGRIDHQIKLRGFRIELGEIDAVLRQHEGVSDAVAVLRDDRGEPRIVGYFVARGETATADLRAYLRERLPEHMVPSAFVRLDAMPLTPNGKVDRAALPAPELVTQGDAPFVAPRGPVEEAIAAIFAEILHVPAVSADDGFFDLGGHSLLATQVVARIRDALGADITLRALFEDDTPRGLARVVEAARAEAPAAPIAKVPRGGDLPLSFAEERFWFLDQLEPGSAAYVVPLGLRLRGPLDEGALSRALTEIARRHEVLRTTYVAEGGRPVAKVHDGPGLVPEVIDLAHLSSDVRDAAARDALTREAAVPFDLAEGPLARARLLRFAPDDHALLISLHHAVADGWSLGVLLHEIGALYGAFSRGAPSPLAEPTVQVLDWAAWQRAWLSGDVLDRQLTYWKQALQGAPRALEMPTDRPRPPVPSHGGDRRPFHVSKGVLTALESLAREHGATLFMTVLAALHVLLHRTSGQTDIVVGSPIAGRTRAETEGLLGFFGNTLALRATIDDERSFADLLAQVRETCLGAYAHQDLPFERLVQEIEPERDPSRTPLFQITLTVQSDKSPSLAMPGVAASRVGVDGASAKFDLSVALGVTTEGLSGAFEFATDLFDGDTIERLSARFATLLGSVARDPSQRIWQIPILPDAERERLLVTWAGGGAVFAPRACLHELFEERADVSRDRLAVTCEGESLAYGELDRRANQIASLLAKRGVGPGTLVGLAMDRSLDLIVSLLGILKAGGAYLPLDPEYPRDRIAFMIEDAKAPVILTHDKHEASFAGVAAALVRLDADAAEIAAEPSNRLGRRASPSDLAYVIYTSGSTGKPKGAMVTHHNVARLFEATEHWYGFDASDVWTMFHSYAFDFSVWEIWGALLHGGRLVVVPYFKSRAPDAFYRLLLDEGVTVLSQTPSAFRQLVAAEEALSESDSARLALRYVIFGGEALDVGDLRPFWDRHGDEKPRLVNMYGITETTVHVTYRPVSRADLDKPWSSVIGVPIPDLSVHVLDAHRQPVPIGVVGEMYVGGAGVTRGYLARPDLTADRFVESPFRAGETLYKTGDLARYLASGDIEYLGRIDHQVKIRGFRIELGEIEAALDAHEGVREAVVIARDDQGGGKRLCAYLVLAGATVSTADLRAFLKQRLPDYMVPSAFVVLDAMPLGPTGKIDRKALPEPEEALGKRAYVAPSGPVEETLSGIYADVLGLSQGGVGAEDGFFDLGGHSLLATQAVARVREAFGVDLPLRALFEGPTVRELAASVKAALDAGLGMTAPPLVRAPREGRLPISFAQERLWFLDQLEPGDPSYIVPRALRVRGPIDVGALSRALTEIVRRHEVLRTAFALEGDRPAGVLHDPAPVAVDVTRWPALSPSERDEVARREVAAEARRPFDLAAAPMLRARLFEIGEGDHVLSLTMHHIVSDAWTEGVFYRELATLYGAFAANEPSPWPELSIQYADFAAWQRAWLSGDVEARQLAYWREALSGAPAALDLPADRPRPPAQSHVGGRRTVTLDADLLADLTSLSRREGVTLFMTLLAAFDVLLHRVTGQPDIVVGSPIAGRTRAETEPLVGFFVNTLVLRAKLEGESPFRDLLRRVRESCLGAYAHQDMPFERLVQELAPERDLSRSPLFQVMFALQNAGGSGVALPGLDVRGFAADTAASKFDLTLVMTESGAGLVASMEYAADLFDASTIERLLSHLERVLRAIAREPGARIGDLPLLSPEEERRLTIDWNEPSKRFPPRASVHAMFEAVVDRSPDAPAVTFEGATLTYRELDERANRVAHALIARGVDRETLVGLAVERSLDTLVGILGILKAGGAYLPLDPDYPEDRLAFMIADSEVRIVLSHDAVAKALPEHGAAILRLDLDWPIIAEHPATRPSRAVDPASLAYVIYTSGSTGKPKGAMVTHHNVARLFEATEAWFGFGPSDVWTMFHSYAFDFSVWEIWGALFYGGRVVVVPYWVSRAPDTFHALLASEGVTVLSQTPSAFRQLVAIDEGADAKVRDALRLRYVVFGGEALDLGDLRPWWDRHGDTAPQLVNMYGITETTVHVTYRPVGRADLDRPWASVIGRPIPDLQVYILDMFERPVPIGVSGEMYVGGAGVSRGYLRRPELTAARFIADPYRPGGTLYRTGDLARHLANGDVEYLGRIDHQVKIRGFRIELGEIEAVLDQHPSVRESVVLARQDEPGDKRLVAYLVMADGPRPTATELRAFVKQKLPDMMVPAAFVLLDAMPLTENGKIDRKALPAPEEAERAELGGEFVAPASDVEERLAEIWATSLRLAKVGVNDNFFEIGGDSILSIQIVNKAQQAGIFITARQIFQHPTIADLALVAGSESRVAAEQGPVTGPAPLTPIQRYWLAQGVDDAHHYNQAFFLELRDRLSPALLEEAWAAMLSHHDALRIRLSRGAGGDRQTIAAPGGPAPIGVLDLAGVADADLQAAIEPRAAEAQASLDLESGPIARVVLFDTGPDRPQRLLVVVHHIAIDGVSWRVLLGDLWAAYEQRLRGEPIALPPKTTSFKQWAERLAAYAKSEGAKAEAAYWLSDARRHAAPMPVDRGGDNTEASARSVVVSLTPEETEKLLRQAPEAYQTQINDLLLTALAEAWRGFTGSAVTVLDLEGHGREDLFEDVDLTRTLGWFTALYPLAIELPEGGPGARIKSVKEQIRGVPGRGVGYGLLRYMGDLGAELASLPQAEVSFNYLGQLDQALPESSPFRFARERSGPSHSLRARRPYLLDVTASVARDKLSIQWTYSEARHQRATIEALAESYLAALRGLVDHCLSPEAGGYTPSDFQEPGLSQDVIDMLAGLDDDDDDDADV